VHVKSVTHILITISVCSIAAVSSGCNLTTSNENLEVLGIRTCNEAETFINTENNGLETIRRGYIEMTAQCYADFMTVLSKVSNRKCKLSESQPTCAWETSSGARTIKVFSETPSSMTISNGAAQPNKLIYIYALN